MTVDYRAMLYPELVFLDLEVSTETQLFEQISKRLFDRGYVKESYCEALQKREQEFPTGLLTKYLPVALPHTDPEHVNQAFICMVKNRTPLDVLQMGLNEPMQAKYFFFLGITDSKNQVILLQKFMKLLQDDNFVTELTSITDEKQMFEFLQVEFDK